MGDGDDQGRSGALRQRRVAAWAQVYDELAPDMLAFLLHLLRGDRRATEEVHQEVWLAALAGIDGYDEQRAEFRAWVFGIARRKVALHLRQRTRNQVQQSDEQGTGDEAVDEGALLPHDVIIEVERASAVRAALAEMGLEARRVLEGKYVDGRSVNELAEQLECSPKAVESLLSRSRTRLRALLRWYFDSEQAIKDSQ